MKRILTIGDIHGRDAWKFLTHGSPYEYNLWRISVEAGAPADDYDFWKEQPYTKFDKIIFVGDYVDSYDISNIIIKQNLEDIVHLKRCLGDRVVLLLGNHDVQYIVHNQVCSGYRSAMRHDLYQIFTENTNFFKIAHEEEGEDGSKWLWSHAGVTSGWYDKVLLKDMYNPRFRLNSIVVDHKDTSVSGMINLGWELRMDDIFNVDGDSGGMSVWAGPLWVRPRMMNYWPLEGYNQVMGHTPQQDIWIVTEDEDGEAYKGYKHHYVDCLETSMNGLEIEI
jgi:hypothetical protein